MQKSETTFWSLVGISAVYIVLNFASSPKATAQIPQQLPQVVAAQAGMKGMGCMAKGGGCGCGGMMKKQ